MKVSKVKFWVIFSIAFSLIVAIKLLVKKFKKPIVHTEEIGI